MSLARSTRCLLATTKSAPPSRQIAARCIHSSSRRHDSKRSSEARKNSNGKPSKASNDLATISKREQTQSLGLPPSASPETIDRIKSTLAALQSYTPEERAELMKKYSPEQMAVIDVGEEAIDKGDIARQGTLRIDPMSIDYIDDFSTIHPVLDKRPQRDVLHYEPNPKFKESEDFVEDWKKFIMELPEDADRVELRKFFDNTLMHTGKPEAESEAVDYSAPELPKLTDPIIRQQARAMAKDDSTDEMTPYYERLTKQTGLTTRQIKAYRKKTLLSKRVVNQTRLGKISSIYNLVVVGNGNGLLGIGEGKSAETMDADRIAHMNAIRNLTPVPRYEDRTIFGDVKGKSGATELTLYNRPPGFGIRCQEKIYEMCKCAGITDLAARVNRCRNPMNTVKAAYNALMSQRDPEQVARARGRKLVDVRKVYYAGNV